MTFGRAWPRSSIASASALSCGARRATSTSAWPWSANTFGQRRADAGGGAGDHGDGFASPAWRQGARELGDHLLRDRLGLDLLRIVGIAARPRRGCRSIRRKARRSSVRRCCTSKLERRNSVDLGLDHHVVAELGRLEEPRPGVHHRIALELVVPRELVLAHAQRLGEQRGGAAIEHREIAREEHDPGRVAVAPFDPGVARVGQHCSRALIAAPCGARRRAGSPRR